MEYKEKIVALLKNKRTGIPLILGVCISIIALWFLIPAGVSTIKKSQDYSSRSVVSVSLPADEKRKLEKEITDIKNAIRSSNKGGEETYAKQYRELGVRYVRLGMLGKAVEAYDDALREEPKHAETLLAKAEVLASMKEFEKAEQTYREAIDIQPNDQTAYVKLAGMYHYRMNDPETARGVYLEGLTRSNNDINLLRSFATYLEIAGRPEEAYLYWDAIYKKNPADSSAKNRRDALKAYNPEELLKKAQEKERSIK